jgi:hypothetical protein
MVRFPSKGAERQGLLIADPQQLKGVIVTGFSELSTQNPEAPEPYSHDNTKGPKYPRKDEDIEKQLVHQ